MKAIYTGTYPNILSSNLNAFAKFFYVIKGKTGIYLRFSFPFLLILVFSLFSYNILAATYYISPTGSDVANGSITTPFATLNKAWTVVAAGDLIYMRGGTYTFTSQQILSGKNGTAGNLIKVWAYPGESPLISINPTSKAVSLAGNYINFKGIELNGLATITGWNNLGNGIYSKAVICESPTNMVTINGVNTAMGRYPNAGTSNSGYLTIDSHSSITSITDAALPLPSVNNWTGGELVVRRYHWVIDRSTITNHTANTLTYTGGSSEPMDGYGYFIQNHINTLDQLGEWFYNGITLYMYFGSNNPTSYVVKTSTASDLMYVNNSNYVTFENMTFKGGNLTSFRLSNSDYFTLQNCTIDYSGQYGFNGYHGGTSTNLLITGSTIKNSNSAAIMLFNAFSDVIIDNNIISNTGLYAGMGSKSSLSGIHEGIWTYQVNYTTVKNNRIINTGYNGVHLNGRASIIRNNFIDTFCSVMDDGGGIYFYIGDASVTRLVKDNIILNGIGASNGTTWTDTPQVEGIYTDGVSENIEISGNSVANCGSHGLYLHNSVNINAYNNTLFNNGKEQFKMQHNSEGAATRGIIFKKNIVFSKLTTQKLVHYYSILDDIALFGTMDSNYYAAPLNTTPVTTPLFETKCSTTWGLRTFANWKSYSGKDTYSTFSATTVPNASYIVFVYNDSTVNKTVSLGGTYLDAKGNQYVGSITLAPYTSAVLMLTTSTNQAPSIQNQGFQLNENSPNGTTVGTVVASDPNAGQTLTYSILSGNTNGAFAISTSTGTITVANSSALNYEAATSFALVVKVQDNGAGNLSSQATITVNLLNINEPPVVNNQIFSIQELSANGTIVGTVAATDPDAGQTKAFAITSGNTSNAFSINSTSGVITVAASSALNYLVNPVFNLNVRVTDNGSGNLFDDATITINVTTTSNQPPVIANQTFSANENSPNGTSVGNVVASDPNAGQTLTYSILSGNTNNAFAINAATGALTVLSSAALNYEVITSFALIVKVQDNGTGNLSSQATITITLLNVNESPVVSNQIFSVSGNVPNGTVVGTVVASDPDGGQTLNYSILSGNTNGAFALNASTGVITVASSTALANSSGINYSLFPAAPSISQNYVGTGSAPLEVGMKFFSNVNGVISGLRFYKGAGGQGLHIGNLWSINGTNLASATYTGETASGWQTVTLSSPVAITANTLYVVSYFSQHGDYVKNDPYFTTNIVNGPLTGIAWTSSQPNGVYKYTATSAFPNNNAYIGSTNYWADVVFTPSESSPASFNLLVKVQDNGSGNLSNQATMSINTVSGGNNPPTINNQTFTVSENASNGTAVGTVVATDPDAGQTLTYSIQSGNTNGAFAINAATGAITVANSAALNYEVVTSFALVIKVQDNGTGNLSSQATVTVSLLNVNELPIISNQAFTVNENSANGTVIGSVLASDPDAGQSLAYSILSGNTNGAFAINASTGAITVANSAAINYEVITSFALIVKVQDNGTGNLNSQATITITIFNVNEPPVVNNQTFSIVQLAANGTQVGTVAATDPDAGQTRSFAITSGNTSGAFSINSSSGILTVSNSSVLVYQTNPVFNLNVRVTDNGTGNLYDDATITINVQNTNQPPAILNQAFSLNENSINGTVVGNILASDPDAGQTLAYSILSGNTSGAFAINASTGLLTVANTTALNFEVNPSFALVVKVQDNGTGNLSSQATITVNLLNLNELPIINNQTFTVNENVTIGTVIGSVVASDPDAGQTLTYSIQSGNTNGAFAINATTGALSVASTSALNYEVINSFALIVKVQDNGTGNLSNQATITVTIFNVNELPVITNQSFYVNENSPNGTSVGTIVASDPDAVQILTYSILSGNTNSAFSINASTGVLTVSNSASLNYEAITSFALVVKVQDNGTGNLSSQATITITLYNLNESPVVSNQTFSVSGNSPNGTVVGTVIASDPDAGQTLTYSILSGNTDGAFAINPSTGVMTVSNSAAFSNGSGTNYSLFQATPSIAQNYVGNGNAPLEVGMKFFSTVNGSISGLRFYKGAGGQGLHIGNLWSINGTNLASATFTGETASGWQTVTLSTPVTITANTIYVVSYFSQHGDYVKNDPYFTANIVNGPLTGLGWSSSQPNGVYKYSSISTFPDNSAYTASANYWADVVFSPTPSPSSFALIVKVQDNGIGNLSSQATITINVQQAMKSSLSDNNTNSTLNKTRIYPNPVINKILNVEPGNGFDEQFDLAIFDMSGKAIMRRHFDHMESISLDLSAYSAGVYALQIRSFNFIFSDKFILK